MNCATDRVAAAACQRLLAASNGLVQLSALAWLAAFAALWAWASVIAPRMALAAALAAGSLCIGMAALYYGWRVRLDAGLFALLGEPGEVGEAEFAAGMDLFRAQLLGHRNPGGLLGQRYSGALRLWRSFAAALGLQLALLAGAACAACLTALVGG